MTFSATLKHTHVRGGYAAPEKPPCANLHTNPNHNFDRHVQLHKDVCSTGLHSRDLIKKKQHSPSKPQFKNHHLSPAFKAAWEYSLFPLTFHVFFFFFEGQTLRLLMVAFEGLNLLNFTKIHGRTELLHAIQLEVSDVSQHPLIGRDRMPLWINAPSFTLRT